MNNIDSASVNKQIDSNSGQVLAYKNSATFTEEESQHKLSQGGNFIFRKVKVVLSVVPRIISGAKDCVCCVMHSFADVSVKVLNGITGVFIRSKAKVEDDCSLECKNNDAEQADNQPSKSTSYVDESDKECENKNDKEDGSDKECENKNNEEDGSDENHKCNEGHEEPKVQGAPCDIDSPREDIVNSYLEDIADRHGSYDNYGFYKSKKPDENDVIDEECKENVNNEISIVLTIVNNECIELIKEFENIVESSNSANDYNGVREKIKEFKKLAEKESLLLKRGSNDNRVKVNDLLIKMSSRDIMFPGLLNELKSLVESARNTNDYTEIQSKMQEFSAHLEDNSEWFELEVLENKKKIDDLSNELFSHNIMFGGLIKDLDKIVEPSDNIDDYRAMSTVIKRFKACVENSSVWLKHEKIDNKLKVQELFIKVLSRSLVLTATNEKDKKIATRIAFNPNEKHDTKHKPKIEELVMLISAYKQMKSTKNSSYINSTYKNLMAINSAEDDKVFHECMLIKGRSLMSIQEDVKGSKERLKKAIDNKSEGLLILKLKKIIRNFEAEEKEISNNMCQGYKSMDEVSKVGDKESGTIIFEHLMRRMERYAKAKNISIEVLESIIKKKIATSDVGNKDIEIDEELSAVIDEVFVGYGMRCKHK